MELLITALIVIIILLTNKNGKLNNTNCELTHHIRTLGSDLLAKDKHIQDVESKYFRATAKLVQIKTNEILSETARNGALGE